MNLIKIKNSVSQMTHTIKKIKRQLKKRKYLQINI